MKGEMPNLIKDGGIYAINADGEKDYSGTAMYVQAVLIKHSMVVVTSLIRRILG